MKAPRWSLIVWCAALGCGDDDPITPRPDAPLVVTADAAVDAVAFSPAQLWGPPGAPPPEGAEIIPAAQLAAGLAAGDVEIITQAGQAAAVTATRERLEAARALVDAVGLTPAEPRESARVHRADDGNFRVDLTGASVIVHGRDWLTQEIAGSLERTPARDNREANVRALLEVLPDDLRADLPAPDALGAVDDVALSAAEREVVRRAETYLPNEPFEVDAEVVAAKPRRPDLVGFPGTGCGNHQFDHVYAQMSWPLKPFTTRVRAQGSRGTCVAHAIHAAIETHLKRTRGLSTDYSEQELYAVAKVVWFPTADYYGDGLSLGSVLDELADRDALQPVDGSGR